MFCPHFCVVSHFNKHVQTFTELFYLHLFTDLLFPPQQWRPWYFLHLKHLKPHSVHSFIWQKVSLNGAFFQETSKFSSIRESLKDVDCHNRETRTRKCLFLLQKWCKKWTAYQNFNQFSTDQRFRRCTEQITVQSSGGERCRVAQTMLASVN